MAKYRVVAEKSHGLFYGDKLVRNPFKIRNIFDPNLRSPIERRTWESIEARNEKELRRLFDEAVKTVPGMAGFVITKIAPAPAGAVGGGGDDQGGTVPATG